MSNSDNPDSNVENTGGAGTIECRRCGTCCTLHQAFVNPDDIKRISAFLGITMDDWMREYDDPSWRYSDYQLIRHVDGACAFLKYENGLSACAIHPVKPACCANWQSGPDKKECRQGAAGIRQAGTQSD